MARKSKMTPRQILTYLSILALVISLASGAGWTLRGPGQAKASEQEELHDSDKRVQAEVDKGQNTRIEKVEENHKQITEDLGGLKAGQKRIETSLEQMANN